MQATSTSERINLSNARALRRLVSDNYKYPPTTIRITQRLI